MFPLLLRMEAVQLRSGSGVFPRIRLIVIVDRQDVADEGARNPAADIIGELNIGPGPPGGDGAAEAPGRHLNDLVAARGGFAVFTDRSGLSAG